MQVFWKRLQLLISFDTGEFIEIPLWIALNYFFTPQRASALLCYNFNQELIDTVMQFFVMFNIVNSFYLFFFLFATIEMSYIIKRKIYFIVEMAETLQKIFCSISP